MGISTRNAHSDMLEIVELKSWPVDIFVLLQKKTISEKYTHYVDILKHVVIKKFSARNTNDMSLERPLKV